MTKNAYKAKTVSDNEIIELLRKHIEANIAMIDLNPTDSENSEFEKRLDAYGAIIDIISEIQQYRAIGTVEECREARERQRGKKPVKDEYNHECCPNCGWIVYQDEWGGRYLPHCENCGQSIS